MNKPAPHITNTILFRFAVRLSLILFITLGMMSYAFSQKVGVVLSGGGAAGMAHIGFLKALEKHDIPIDYITGTSMGALIGGMYAAGYSPDEIQELLSSDKFKLMASGEIEDDYVYFFKQDEKDASWINIRFNSASLLETTIPTNLVNPVLMDYELMAGLSHASANADYDFNDLFVPFRCVAADIAEKESVIFSEGHLNEAIRASMAYPFYMKPVKFGDKILFDGGLYNNFPADILIDEFGVDIILGSNVSGEIAPPTEDDLISQIKNMLINRKKQDIPEGRGVVINHDTQVATLDFSRIGQTVALGYKTTLDSIVAIQGLIERRVEKAVVDKKRTEFNSKRPELTFDEIKITGLTKNQEAYVRNLLRTKEDTFGLEELKVRYFRVFYDSKIKNIYPKAVYKPETGKYRLDLNIKPERDFTIQFGGNFSSRPINTGFIGLKYNYFGRYAWTLNANSYFGRFYGSTSVRSRIDFPTKLPFYLEPEFTMNRWDYFKSFATFFEDVRPSFLVHNEHYFGMNTGFSIGAKSKLVVENRYSDTRFDYYQTQNFLSTDTFDVTNFESYIGGLTYEYNTLNRKQYANEGTLLKLSGHYIRGDEESIPGSTAFLKDPVIAEHEWLVFKAVFDKYFNKRGWFKLGIYGEAVYSTQGFFSNYTSTILAAPAFQPIQESSTIFLNDFRAFQYGAGGLKAIISLHKNVDFRAEGYIFQPYQTIRKNKLLRPVLEEEFATRFYVGTAGIVYHSPLGPVSASLNYHDTRDKPFSFLFHFGYILFNNKSFN